MILIKKGFDVTFGIDGLYFPEYSEYGIFLKLSSGWRFTVMKY